TCCPTLFSVWWGVCDGGKGVIPNELASVDRDDHRLYGDHVLAGLSGEQADENRRRLPGGRPEDSPAGDGPFLRGDVYQHVGHHRIRRGVRPVRIRHAVAGLFEYLGGDLRRLCRLRRAPPEDVQRFGGHYLS